MLLRGEEGGSRVEAMRWLLLMPLLVTREFSSLARGNESDSLTMADLVGDANGLSGKLCSALGTKIRKHRISKITTTTTFSYSFFLPQFTVTSLDLPRNQSLNYLSW